MTTSFAEQVSTAVENMTIAEDGTYTLPDGLDEQTSYAANAERRRRDTQASFSKAQNDLTAAKAENEKLLKGWEGDLSLTTTQNEELDDLKLTDPDAWRKKINAYEDTNKEEFRKARNDESEVERRTRVMNEFLTDHEGFELTDSILENDVPPRIVKRLESSEISFEDFLDEVYSYLTKGKTIAQPPQPSSEPNLSTARGSSIPGQSLDQNTGYDKETY